MQVMLLDESYLTYYAWIQYLIHYIKTMYLLSGSNLHSLFLWPQNCTYRLIIDPEKEIREQPYFNILHVAEVEGGNNICVALIGHSPYKSPSDWLLLPFPLLRTLTWCPAAECSGD